MEVIYSPETPPLSSKRVIFLAGPVRCAINWQQRFIDYAKAHPENFKDTVIANPRGINELITEADFTEDMFNAQVAWEEMYLEAAAKNGFIVFFLAEQFVIDLAQSYARTSRFELGEWFAELKHNDNVKLIIGSDSKFQGLRYIKNRFESLFIKKPNIRKQVTICDDGLNSLILTVNKLNSEHNG